MQSTRTAAHAALVATLMIPAAAVHHSSCRIGDVRDMVDRGLVSHANEPARQLGCVPGLKVPAGLDGPPRPPIVTPKR